MGGMGGAILENLEKYKIQMLQRWYDVLCKIMAETSNSTRHSLLSPAN